MKSKRTLATSIKNKVRQRVRERDKWCIFCGRSGTDTMHFVPRSSGGLGIEQNLALGCRTCHMMLDQTTKRKEMLKHFERHLQKHYGEFDRKDLIYKKYETYSED